MRQIPPIELHVRGITRQSMNDACISEGVNSLQFTTAFNHRSWSQLLAELNP